VDLWNDIYSMKSIFAKLIRLLMKGFTRGPHITRYYMYERLSYFKQSPCIDARVLTISHSNVLGSILGLDKCKITDANYPKYNILQLPFGDKTFDYVVSDQVLEHVEGDPQDAIDETYRVLKPAGLAIHTTCFINPIHGNPSDYWRFTPEALSLLCNSFSEIIDCGGWGNPWVWIFIMLGLRNDGIPNNKLHPINKLARLNDPLWPIVTWIIAEKQQIFSFKYIILFTKIYKSMMVYTSKHI